MMACASLRMAASLVNRFQAGCAQFQVIAISFLAYTPPLTSTWPHLRCDVGLEEGEHRENCLCLAVL